MDPSTIPRFNRMPWAALLKRVVTKTKSIQAILDSLGIASEAPRFRPARSPPQGELVEDRYDDADPPAPEW